MKARVRHVWYAFFGFWFLFVGWIAKEFHYVERVNALLPAIDYYQNYHPYQTSFFYDRNGAIIGCVAHEWREVVPKESIDSLLITKLILETEDRRYYAWYRTRLPIDFIGIFRAVWVNYRAGSVVEGGSTIEQQTVKLLLPRPEQQQRTMQRKFKELFLAFRLLNAFDKKTILWLYLNETYLGNGQFGIGAAAHWYFNKDVASLTLPETALLAGLIKAPEAFSPYYHPQSAKERRNTVLRTAYEHGIIGKQKYQEALSAPLGVSKTFLANCRAERHLVDYIKSNVIPGHYGFVFDKQKRGFAWRGFRVYTTVDIGAQKAAREGLLYALTLYQNRQKARAIETNGAFVILDNQTGAIRALIGGKDYNISQYNNVTQAKRQIGSAFKPFDYVPFIEEMISLGVTPEEILNTPISNKRFSCRGRTRWRRWSPQNYDESKMGAPWYSMKDAIAKSINRPALHAAMDPLIHCSLNPEVAVAAYRLGISPKGFYEVGLDGKIYFRLPIALGAVDLTPLELTRAYMVFANKGLFREEYIVNQIDAVWGAMTSQQFEPEQRLEPLVANTVHMALRGAVEYGTARSLGHIPLPIAGKTGTTDNFSDAWFVGFLPGEFGITFGVWIGGKNKTVSLGSLETGGRTAIPAIQYFFEHYYSLEGLALK